MSDENVELPPEMEEVLQTALLNGWVNEVDEVMVRSILTMGMMIGVLKENHADVGPATESFLVILGHYRDSWMERVMVVLKQEFNQIFTTRLTELRANLPIPEAPDDFYGPDE